MTETSTVTAFSTFFIILASILMLALPRRFAIFPILMAVCYITIGQVLVIAGLHFQVFRILIFFGFLRIIIRKEIYDLKLNSIDKAIIWWVIISIITGILLEKSWDVFINRLGLAYSALGCYFLFRFLLRDRDDLLTLIKMVVIIIIPLTISVLIEKTTGRNIFSVFGGVPEITMVREGRLRCQGPFRHPILMGTFAATLIPLFFSLWFKNNGKLLSFIGIICASILTFASASSGPATAYIYGVIALMAWPVRHHMRSVRWLILFALIMLHMVMKAPVWYLSLRLSELIGGGGWHRAYLIDQAVRYFNEWWLIGTTYTAHWMPYVLPINPNMVDITNQYLVEGVNGGIWRMAAFILIIIFCFRELGKANLVLKDQSKDLRIFSWSLGAALFAHILSFMAVSYFDQIIVFWYLLLAMISVFTNATINSTAEKITPLK